jgi:putative molybdopterin biosynthesis protein
MSEISYTPQEVAEILKISTYTVYELIKRGELDAYHIGRKARVKASDLERFTGGRNPGSLAAQPAADPEVVPRDQVIICGQDLLLDLITRHLEREVPGCIFLRKYVGSMSGLLALFNGQAKMATAHLWDGDTGEYNIPYIRRILPGQRVTVVNLVHRTEGFYVAQGNPLGISGWHDLKRKELRFVNREPGSGARVLLDERLRLLGIDPSDVQGYDQVEMAHMGVASRVARGEADLGLGIEKTARQVEGLDFVPLQLERYDLVLRRNELEQPYAQALLQLLRNDAFRQEVRGMGGYDLKQTGEIIAEL